MRLRTLRIRFALWTSGLLLSALTLFGGFVYFSMSRNLYTALDNALALSASQVSAGLNIDNGKLILSDSLIEAPENADLRGSGFTIRVLTPQGDLIQGFGRYQNLPVSSIQSVVTYTDPASHVNIRVHTQPVNDNNQLVAIIQVAQSQDNVEDTLERLLATLLISIPLLVAIAGGGGYFLASHALAPIDQITATARKISAEDLSARLDVPVTNDEVGRLTQTLNDMLVRLEDSFQRERQFTNDASHELRTPLTAMQAILSVIREKRRTPEEYKQALDDLSEETDRLQTLVGNLLRLARGDRSKSYAFGPVNLSTLLEDVADSLRPLAEAKSLVLHCETAADLTMRGDSDELIRLFVNLLDNAIKYTERGEIRVNAQRMDEQIEVQVSDTGTGITLEHLPHIFDRFYRVDESRTEYGSGLGLAIAREIINAHDGSIKVHSNINKGSSFTVNLPGMLG